MKELLKQIGFNQTEIEFTLETEERVGDKVYALAKAYMKQENRESFQPLLEKLEAFTNETLSIYSLKMLFWLYCAEMLKPEYEKKGFDEQIYYDSMSDIHNKVQECVKVYSIIGVFEDWFHYFFEMKLFALGRNQYAINSFEDEYYMAAGYEIKKGDRVYACHIPSSEVPLTQETTMESLHKAYEFFKDELNSSIIPVTCRSWLLYPRYSKEVFPKESRLRQFAENFDVIRIIETPNFEDSWRVFSRMYTEGFDNLPQNTTLQQNFVKYIESGGSFGGGYGVILYDGEKREIINKKV